MTKFNEYYEKRMNQMIEESKPGNRRNFRAPRQVVEPGSTGKPTLGHTVKNFVPNLVGGAKGFAGAAVDKVKDLKLPSKWDVDGDGFSFKDALKGTGRLLKTGAELAKDKVVDTVGGVPRFAANTVTGLGQAGKGFLTNNPDDVDAGLYKAVGAPLEAGVEQIEDIAGNTADTAKTSLNAVGATTDQMLKGNIINQKLIDHDAPDVETPALSHAGDVRLPGGPSTNTSAAIDRASNFINRSNELNQQKKRVDRAVAAR